MKRITKILILLLSLSLIAGALAVAVSAADSTNSMSTLAEPWQYTDTSGTTRTASNLATAVSGAKTGSTVKLLADVTYSTSGNVASIKKELTIDLGGHTFVISQSGQHSILVGTTSLVQICNGTLVASGNSSYGVSGVAYAAIKPDGNNTNLKLRNLNTYTACLFLAGWQHGSTLTIEGGEHHLMFDPKDVFGGGLVETRSSAVVNVSNAAIYIRKSGLSVANSLFYNYNKDATTITTADYTFTNCNIYAEDGKTSIILYAHAKFSAKFIGCSIYGSIDPTLHSYDKATGAITKGAIMLSGGTRVGGSADYSVCDEAVASDGASIINVDEHVSFDFKKASGNAYYNTSTGSLSDITFSIGDAAGEVMRYFSCYGSAENYDYTYDTNGLKYYTDSLETALIYADSSVTLNRDATAELSADNLPYVRKNITLDLCGNKLQICESGKASIGISGGKKLTVKNGSIAKYTSEQTESSYPIFEAMGEGAELSLDGVTVSADSLILSEYDGAKIKIVGGAHVLGAENSNSYGYIDSRAGIDFSASGAVFVSDGAAVVSSASVNSESASSSSFTFNSSTVICSGNIIKYANKNTKVDFNTCDVSGVINPVVCPLDASVGSMQSGSVILGDGTRISGTESNISGGVILPFGKLVFVASASSDNVAYTDAYGTAATKAVTYSYVIGACGDDAVAIYTDGAITTATDNLKSALELADEGTDVILMKDVTLTESAKGFVRIHTPDLTLDLNGHTLELIQQGEAHIYLYADFTVKNGSLRAAMDSTAAGPGQSYPMFCYGLGYEGLTFNLENVDSYAGSLVFAWNCSGHTLNVVGGKHHALNKGIGNDGGWLDVRGDFVLNAKDATFVTNSNSSVVSSLSFKDTNTEILAASFNFTGCNLISVSGRSSLIGCANENSTFRFDACNIYGILNPWLNTNDSNAGYSEILPGAIILGRGTRLLASAGHISGGVIIAEADANLVEIDENLSVKYNDYTFDPVTAEFAIESKRISTSYTLKSVTYSDTLVSVKWYKEDGKTLIKEELIPAGSAATAPDYTPSVSNGWFRAEYSGWSKFFAGPAAASMTVTADTCFYPAPSSALTPEFTAAAHSITLVGLVRNNLYIPVPCDKITIVGVYDASGNALEAKGVTSDGVKYYMYDAGEIGAAKLTDSTSVTVKYIVNGQQMQRTVTLSPAEYARKLLADSKKANPVYPESAHILVADLVRYSNYLAFITGGSTNSVLDELISEYGSLASAMPSSNAFANQTSSTSQLNGIISSIQLEVSSTEPRWIFNVASGASVRAVYINVDGYLPTVVNGVNFGSITYEAYKLLDGTAFVTESIPMYNLDRLMYITVRLSNGKVVRGTYSLDSYFNGFAYSSDEDGENVKTFIKAFRAFGESSSAYKYGDRIVKEGPTVDFWQCDHNALSRYFTGRGRYCADCATNIFFYSDYGAIADGVSDRAFNTSGTNSYEAMYKCHSDANVWADKGNKSAVMAVGGAHSGTTYYIGAPYLNQSIDIKTDTNWSGAEFIVDDRTVDQELNNGYYTPVFTSTPKPKENAIDYSSYVSGGIASGATHIGFAPGRPMMMKLTDLSRRNNIRQGANENSGASISEVILVDEYGNISPTTPVEWDYYNVTYCTYKCTTANKDGNSTCDVCGKTISTSLRIYGYPTDYEPITISGLDRDGNINFVWETVTDSTVDITEYDQCARTIRIRRSNVTVSGIDHIFTEDDTSTTPRQAYAGIVSVSTCNNVTVSDMLVINHLGHSDVNGVGFGSYEFSGGEACNISLINWKTKNFFWDDGRITYRGLFGTNYIRNFYLKDCLLNSFDSHSGAYNVTIEDSTFEHINYVGGGDVYMKNVTVYTDGSDAACILRQDYGSMWHGNIYIDGLDLRYSDTSNKCIDLVESSYTNWYFGTDTYLPTEIVANNVVIHRYQRSDATTVFENGTLEENIVGTNEIPLGIHYQINRQMTAHTDYSVAANGNLDPKHCTERIEINNSGNLSLLYPDHTYFESMDIYRDGVELDWFSQRETLVCQDLDGDYVCDLCNVAIECSREHPTKSDTAVSCEGCGFIRSATEAEADEALNYAFEYVQNGVTVRQYEGSLITEALTLADDGTTITLLSDCEEELTGTFRILTNLTIDLNGYTLSLKTTQNNEAFSLSSGKTVTFKNGTAICMSSVSKYGSGRPLLNLGNNATVNYENMTTFTGVLVFSYDGNNCTANIIGGEHYAVASSAAGCNAFIETRANIDFTAIDAMFVLTNNAAGTSYNFISALSYKQAEGTDRHNSYTFDNCDILNFSGGNLFNNTNKYLKVVFDNCRISGKINNGTVHSWDTASGAAISGFVTLGEGTQVIGSGSTYISTLATLADGTSLVASTSTKTYTIKQISGSLYEGNFSYSETTKSVTYLYKVS